MVKKKKKKKRGGGRWGGSLWPGLIFYNFSAESPPSALLIPAGERKVTDSIQLYKHNRGENYMLCDDATLRRRSQPAGSFFLFF